MVPKVATPADSTIVKWPECCCVQARRTLQTVQQAADRKAILRENAKAFTGCSRSRLRVWFVQSSSNYQPLEGPMLRRRTFLGLLAGTAGSILALSRALRPSSWWKRRVQAAPPMDAQSTTSIENQSGIKITTVHRSTSRNGGGDVFAWSNEETFYVQGEWRRDELPRSVRGGGSTPRIYGPRVVSIVRPDLRQQFDLNLDASQYSQSSLDWLYSPPQPLEKLQGLTKEELQAMGIKMPPPPSDKVTFRIETVTKDTGERKEMFGYLARHVITTRKEIPLEGSRRAAQEMTKDGWYIDIEPQSYPALYPPHPLPASKSAQPGRLRSYLSGGSPVPEKPEFVDVGEPETGFALQELRMTRLTFTRADGSTVQHDDRAETLVTLEKGTYDVALFEVPSGFKRVPQINRNPA
jgi:hypothetical protein